MLPCTLLLSRPYLISGQRTNVSYVEQQPIGLTAPVEISIQFPSASMLVDSGEKCDDGVCFGENMAKQYRMSRDLREMP